MVVGELPSGDLPAGELPSKQKQIILKEETYPQYKIMF